MDLRRAGSKQLEWTLITLFLLWLSFCLGSYYGLHKPLTWTRIVELANDRDLWKPITLSPVAATRALFDLLAAGWLTLMALGTGRRILRSLQLSQLSPPIELVFSLALGFGLLGLLTFVIGLLGLMSKAVFYAVGVILTLLAFPGTWPFIRQIKFKFPNRLVLVYLAIVTGACVSVAPLPPTSWDGLTYHLLGPQHHLQAGHLQFGCDIPQLRFPCLVEMLFTFGLAIRGDVVCRLIHGIFGLLLGAMVYLTARDHLRLPHGWTAVLSSIGSHMPNKRMRHWCPISAFKFD